MEIQKPRPPYVTFAYRPVEDREKSITTGHYCSRDVAYAFITPAGSKDRIEKIAEEWLVQLASEVRQERFPQEWLNHYREAYKAWKDDRELPVDGTSVTQWPVASPAQVEMLLGLRIRTVEDLASLNEEAISRLGMGGRSLKQKAVDWLASAKNHGQSAEAMSSLRAKLEQSETRVGALQMELTAAQIQLRALTRDSVGVPQPLADDDGGDFDLQVAATPAPQPIARKL